MISETIKTNSPARKTLKMYNWYVFYSYVFTSEDMPNAKIFRVLRSNDARMG